MRFSDILNFVVCVATGALAGSDVVTPDANTAAGVCRFYDFISTYPGDSDIPSLYPAFSDRILAFKCNAYS
ncbi:hypothetical protein GGI35DRAFT_481795 [Trichoderma velutinum]